MSRVPPFPPTRRPRTPSVSNGNGPTSSPTATPTRPLQVNRPPSRPTTPSNNAPSPRGLNTTPTGGPSRPQRSELRNRVSEYSSSDRASTSYGDYSRDSTSTTGSLPYRPRPSGSEAKFKSPPISADGGQVAPTPTSLNSVMSAFKSAGSRRRALTNGSDDMEYQKERQLEVEQETQRQQRIREKVPGRRVNGKARAGDIDAVLDQIKDEWDFVVDPDFNNVDLALQLLDDSSLGKDMNSFRRTKNVLSKALKGSVDKHYQAFNASLPHHASVLNHLGDTQTQISQARTSLQEAKDALGSKRADLVQLWSRGQTLEEMMRILDQIEQLKSVPDVLETLMSEKRLLQASVLLVRSLKMINKQDMLEIGAVSDLRSYLNGQETALREILIDELHSHLYLKSFWCESRWVAYSPDQQSFPRAEFEDEIDSMKPLIQPIPPDAPSFRPSRLTRYLNDLTVRPNDPPYDLDDLALRNSDTTHSNPHSGMFSQSSSSVSNLATSSVITSQTSQNINPESNSFAYMETLIESLAVLGKLGSALDNVAQRLPGEVYTLVESTLDEVEERAEYGQKRSMFTANAFGKSDGVFISKDLSPGISASQGGFLKPSALRLAALESSTKQVDQEILKDFFWTLYSKLDAVAQGLRVVYEVANRVGSRRDFKDSSGTKPGSLFPISEVWLPVEAEVRALLHDYLTDDEQSAISGRNPISSINEILRDGRFTRDKTKPVFRFADTDTKLTSKALKPHEDELNRVLKDTMPGLVQGAENTVQLTLSTAGSDDRLLGVGQHHRLLIRPDAFHVSVLFRPSLAFADRVKDNLPPGSENAQSAGVLLDEFVLKVYLPQLEDKVSSLFHDAVHGPEAFQIDPLSMQFSSEPLVKAGIQLMALINSLCAMLRTTPFHRENYSRLIIGVIIQFYQRCSDRFQDLVSTSPSKDSNLEPRIALGAQWAQRPELNPCLSALLTTIGTDAGKLQQLCGQETHLELEFLGQSTISEDNLVLSLRNLSALGSLYHSVSWLVEELKALRATAEEPLYPATPQVLEPMSTVTPYTPYLPLLPPIQTTGELTLPLSRDMALRFQALLKTYEQLSELILHSIRIDVRCRTIYYLDLAMRYGNYQIDREAGEPDPHIIDLNAELGKCDDLLSNTLSKQPYQFIFVGLGQLMDRVLISNARHLGLVNTFGIKKMLRNMVALQQSIKTITNEENTDFEQAKQYYALFSMSPPDMLDSIRQKQVFSLDEYHTMLDLQCGVIRSGETTTKSDRNYSMYVIDLHGLELETSVEEFSSP